MEIKTRRTKKMKSKDIKSLKKLRSRKKIISRQIEECEEIMLEDYAALTQPASNFVQSMNNIGFDSNFLFNSGFFKFALNAKRVVDMVKLGIAVYKDYKKQV